MSRTRLKCCMGRRTGEGGGRKLIVTVDWLTTSDCTKRPARVQDIVSLLVGSPLFLVFLLFVYLLFPHKAAHLFHCLHLSQTVIWFHPWQYGTHPQMPAVLTVSEDVTQRPNPAVDEFNSLGSEPDECTLVSKLCNVKGMKTTQKCLGFLKRLQNRAATQSPRMIFINRRRALVENSQNRLRPRSCSAWLTFEAAFCG